MDQFKFQSQFPIRKEELFRFHEEPIGFSTLMGANKGIQIIQKPNSLAVGEIAILKFRLFPSYQFNGSQNIQNTKEISFSKITKKKDHLSNFYTLTAF